MTQIVIDPRIKAAIEPVREELGRRYDAALQQGRSYRHTPAQRARGRARADAFHEAILLLAGIDR